MRHVEMTQQSYRFLFQAVRLCQHLVLALVGETAWQGHVLDHGQVRDQVEHLENETDMMRAKVITLRTAECTQLLPQHLQHTGLGQGDAGEQVQQGRLAAAAGATQKYAFAMIDLQ